MKNGLVFSPLQLLALILALAPTTFASTTWYVNGASGSDSNHCMSTQAACKTIGHAIALAASGDSVMVSAGTYIEGLVIGVSLRIVGAGAQTTIIEGGVPRGATISSASAQVILSNLSILRSGISGSCNFQGGAGVYNMGTLTIINSVISDNTAVATSPFPGPISCGVLGGGILNDGKLTIDNSTVSGNSVEVFGSFGDCLAVICYASGGAIASSGTLTINNSTISGNTAVGHCHVASSCKNIIGGIFFEGTSMYINSSTISGNSPTGISRRATLKNSIVANSPEGGNCSGVMTSHGYNLSSDGTCNFNAPGDLNNHNPLLGPLQNNGGPTETMELLPGSPAIDAGNPAGCTAGGVLLKTDQRGMPRPDREDTLGCDMGAYERQSD